MELTEQDIQRVQDTIKNVSSYDFSNYSYNSFCRRIEKILGDYNTTLDELLKDIQGNYNFMEKVVRDITVNTTELFRDTDAWQKIRTVLTQKYAAKESLHIWHAGCSSGQEVYSMMIVHADLEDLARSFHLFHLWDGNEIIFDTVLFARSDGSGGIKDYLSESVVKPLQQAPVYGILPCRAFPHNGVNPAHCFFSPEL